MKQAMRILTLVLCFAVLFVSWPTVGLARTVADEPVVEPDFGAGAITWNTQAGSTTYLMVVSGPDGYRLEQTFASGETISFQAVDASGIPLADGLYKYELKPVVYGITKSRASVNDGRDPAIARELAESQAQPGRSIADISGVFTIQAGQILDPDAEEEVVQAAQPAQVASPSGINAPADQVILDDLIVDGSACIGQDCVNGESFGFDTLRLKENNLRIKAQDTSSTSSFPTFDWQITFNDSSNGGLNKFSIDDIDSGRTPFTIEGAADANSIYVDTGGRIGFGTNSPVVELHVKDGDTPTMRLEQDGSSGFTAQSWDVAGNETNFFVRDVTNGSRLPFRIRPGAPTSSLDIAASGNVGMNTSSPSASLHVRRTDGTSKILVEEANATAANRDLLSLTNNGSPRMVFVDTKSGGLTWQVGQDGLNNWIVNRVDVANAEFTVTKTGNGIFKGTITTSGSCSVGCRAKNRNQRVELLQKLNDVPVIEWIVADSLLSDDGETVESVEATHMSPDMAVFRQVYGLGMDGNSIAPLDVATVALAAAQALNEQAQAHSAQINSLQSQISTLQQQNATLEARLAALEAALGVSAPDTEPQSKSSIFVPSVQR